MASRIEDYALIGDCETAALVGRDGSIDWLCWPRFDSGACFAALLGTPEHGRWLLGAVDKDARVTRRYRDHTLILETDIETADGAATIIDFMPPRGEKSDVVRLVVGKGGTVGIRFELIIRFDSGCIVPWVTRLKDNSVRAIGGPDMVVLRTPAALEAKDRKHVSEFTVSAGQTVPFVLTYGQAHLSLPRPIDPMKALADTEGFWRGWCRGQRGAEEPAYSSVEWSEAVTRSLITLKALTYRPTGGIVAAPTSSLPEQLGGSRNWDYRYCWLRDSTFTLLAMMNTGYYDEARAWREWLFRAVAGDPDRIQIMYGLHGERRLTEWQAAWLSGYEGSQPVRFGNAASEQFQLDVYGEVIDALYHGHKGRLRAVEAGWALQKEVLRHLETIWREPDDGIWEVRGARQHFTFSKVMAWVAFDRAVKSVENFGFEGPVDHWRELRKIIHEEICKMAFDPEVGAFMQSYGSKALDASVLLLPLVGFLPPTDPRVRSTVEAIERRLMVDGFVLRYDTDVTKDGLEGREGSFLPCTFWLADNFVLLGRVKEAHDLFERLLALRNDVGLLSEEYDSRAKRLVGNFPQALSHIALIITAQNLVRAEKPAEQRSA